MRLRCPVWPSCSSVHKPCYERVAGQPDLDTFDDTFYIMDMADDIAGPLSDLGVHDFTRMVRNATVQ